MALRSTAPASRYKIALLLALLVGLQVALKLPSILSAFGPMIANDEWLFTSGARAIFNGDPYRVNIYPPLYPLFLSPAMALGDRFYEGILGINALLTSLLSVPVYLMARRFMSRGPALTAAALVAALPFQFNLGTRLIFAENLTWTLFAAAVVALTWLPRSGWRAWTSDALLGILVSALFLGKFNFLPFIGLFLGLRALFLFASHGGGSLLAARLSITIAVGLALQVPWWVYAEWSGLSWSERLGFYLASTGTIPPQPGSVPFWVTSHFFYVILILLPLVPGVALFVRAEFDRAGRAGKVWRRFGMLAALRLPTVRLTLATTVFGGFALAVALGFALTRAFNHPVPQIISARSFEFVYPLLVVLALTGTLRNRGAKAGLILYGVAAAASVCAWAAVRLLHGDLIWDIPVYFAAAPGTHTFTLALLADAGPFRTAWLLSAPILLAVATSGSGAASRRRLIQGSVVALAFGGLAIWSTHLNAPFYRLHSGQFTGHLSTHAREIGKFVSKLDSVYLYPDPEITSLDYMDPSGRTSMLLRYVEYWLGRTPDARLITSKDLLSVAASGGTVLKVGRQSAEGCSGAYRLYDTTYFVCPCEVKPSSAAGLTEQLRACLPANDDLVANVGALFTYNSAFNEDPEILTFGAGWSATERSHRWTDGDAARLSFKAPEDLRPGQYLLKLKVIAAGQQVVEVRVNDQSIEKLNVQSWFPGKDYAVPIKTALLRPGAMNDLEFRFARPQEAQGRRLGVGVIRMALSPAEAPDK